VDLATFVKLPQLVISSTGDDISFIDSTLASYGYARTIGLEAPYLSAGPVLTRSDIVAVLGRHAGSTISRRSAGCARPQRP
jgi:hypothetical protein